jgi:hypothetical protein
MMMAVSQLHSVIAWLSSIASPCLILLGVLGAVNDSPNTILFITVVKHTHKTQCAALRHNATLIIAAAIDASCRIRALLLPFDTVVLLLLQYLRTISLRLQTTAHSV